MRTREKALNWVQRKSDQLKGADANKEWFKESDKIIQNVSVGFNGPLAEWLAEQFGYEDKECIEFMRRGAPIAGTLSASGLLEKKDNPAKASLKELEERLAKNSRKTFVKLKPDKHAGVLLKEIIDEVNLRNINVINFTYINIHFAGEEWTNDVPTTFRGSGY